MSNAGKNAIDHLNGVGCVVDDIESSSDYVRVDLKALDRMVCCAGKRLKTIIQIWITVQYIGSRHDFTTSLLTKVSFMGFSAHIQTHFILIQSNSKKHETHIIFFFGRIAIIISQHHLNFKMLFSFPLLKYKNEKKIMYFGHRLQEFLFSMQCNAFSK